MRTFKLKDLRDVHESYGCTDRNCTLGSCNEEYVLLKDALAECKTIGNRLDDANAQLRDVQQDRLVVKAQRDAAWQREKLVGAENSRLLVEKTGLDESRTLVIKELARNRELLANANKVIEERGKQIQQREAAIDELRNRVKQLKTAQYSAMYGGSFDRIESQYGGVTVLSYRSASGKDYPANRNHEVLIPAGDLMAFEKQIETLTGELTGILSRDNARDVIYVAGWRWQELTNAASGLKALQIRHEAYGSSLRGEIKLLNEKVSSHANDIKVKNAFIESQAKTISEQRERLLRPTYYETDLHTTLMRLVGVLGVAEGENIVTVAQQAVEYKNSYKYILKSVREALGMQDVSTGHLVIERAAFVVRENTRLSGLFREAVGVLVEVRNILSSENWGDWYKVAQARNIIYKFNTQPTTGAAGSRS